MQAFTIFFGLAIVAIAMENFTAKFLIGKTSVASAKGHQGIQSRQAVDKPKPYTLFGSTGKEKVIITDGNETTEYVLNKTETILHAVSSEITINYINDECCNPDRNVMFTTEYPKRISTAHNPFPTDYQKNWNCSSCQGKSMQNTKKRMNLLSRQQKRDRCEYVRITDDGKLTTEDDCDNCEILEDGQFCQPGNYTVVFKVENQCKDVIFNGCHIPISQRLGEPTPTGTTERCWDTCHRNRDCRYYKYDRENDLCTLLENDYRSFCDIMGGPVNTKVTTCLKVDTVKCDAEMEEDCEYNTSDGKNLYTSRPGAVTQPDSCQRLCEGAWAPDCKYWIHDQAKNLCILKREGKKTCKISGGPKEPKWQFCRDNDLIQ